MRRPQLPTLSQHVREALHVLERNKPIDTVRFTHQREITGGSEIPPRLLAWAKSNLPDGEYITQYQIQTDKWALGLVDDSGPIRKITRLPQDWPLIQGFPWPN